MLILWDDVKRETNIRVHGLDFADVRDGFNFREADIVSTYGGVIGRRASSATA